MGGGLSFETEREVRLALSGADLDVQLDGKPLAPNTSFKLLPGQRLEFRQPRQGLRAYLAFPGGLNAPEVLGSRACTVREQLGGLDEDGKPLKVGDRLTWKAPLQRCAVFLKTKGRRCRFGLPLTHRTRFANRLV